MPHLPVFEEVVGTPSVNAYIANNSVEQILPRDAVLDSINIRVTGTCTHSGYTTPPNKYNESIENLISSVQIVATGDIPDTIKNVDLAWLNRQTQFMEGTQPTRTDVGVNNSAYVFETNARVFFANPRSLSPLNTVLDGRRLGQFSLKLLWRDQTALVWGGVAGASVLSGTQAILLARKVFGYPRFAANGQPMPLQYLKESQRYKSVLQTAQGFEFDNLPTGNRMRRICLKGTVGNSLFGDNSDSLFNNSSSQNIQIKRAGKYPLNGNYFVKRNENKQFYRVESFPAGYVLYEPVKYGGDDEMPTWLKSEQVSAFVDVNFTNASTNTLWAYFVEQVRAA